MVKKLVAIRRNVRLANRAALRRGANAARLRPRRETFKECAGLGGYDVEALGDWRCQANDSMTTLSATQKNGW